MVIYSDSDMFKFCKLELARRRDSIKYFNRSTFDIIMRDRRAARVYSEKGGNAQDYYRTSETLKTDFYNKNGGAYCELLCILGNYGFEKCDA